MLCEVNAATKHVHRATLLCHWALSGPPPAEFSAAEAESIAQEAGSNASKARSTGPLNQRSGCSSESNLNAGLINLLSHWLGDGWL